MHVTSGGASEAATDARTSTRDLADLGQRLAAWFAGHLPAGSSPRLHALRRPTKAGMSSETLLFEMSWQQDSAERSEAYVARLPPPMDACPLFAAYDFDLQVGAMRLVASRSSVPVPAVPWHERDATAVGAPFFIMTRAEGEVVADNPPYVFGGWLREASGAQQACIERELLDVVAGVHGIEAATSELAFLQLRTAGATALLRHFAHQREYYEWGREGMHFPLVERLFDWLESHWPADEDQPVFCWGDARPANVLWCDWKASAVLDWEEATLAPRELDVGYAIFFHHYFRSICRAMTGTDAMTRFLCRDRVAATYEQLTGTRLRNLDWYVTYGLLRQSLVDIRISKRRIRFGEMAPPADANDYLYGRPLLERVLGGDRRVWAE